jgi:hypothetical protein
MASMRSDGKAVDVTLTSTIEKDSPAYVEGFHGIAMTNGSSGDTIALEIALREHEIEVGSSITATKGTILYIDSSGEITNTASDTPFMKVTLAKDDSNIVWGVLLPQS